jgi:hypothetical protein
LIADNPIFARFDAGKTLSRANSPRLTHLLQAFSSLQAHTNAGPRQVKERAGRHRQRPRSGKRIAAV